MSHDPESAEGTVTGTVELSVSGQRLRVEMTVTTAHVRPSRLLPLFQSVTNSLVDIAVKTVETEGEQVSCTKGCAACCRQLVPISLSEAHALAQLLAASPEPQGAKIRARFAAAREQLEHAGLLDTLHHPQDVGADAAQVLGLAYFGLGIACPFLEDESCSIHSDRPLACREYLVSSPAQHCARPTAAGVSVVKLPAKASRVVRELASPAGTEGVAWVPLILAPDWADAERGQLPPRPGPDIVRDFFMRLTKHELPEVASADADRVSDPSR